MRMREDKNIVKYVETVKFSVSRIRASRGETKDENIVSKVLRKLHPIYAIRVSSIQKRRCETNQKITLDAFVGKLIDFELDNYDNYVPASKNIESAFEAKLSLKEKGKKIKEIQSRSEEESEKSFDSDLEVVEALLTRKYSRGRGKYKGKVPLIYF